MPVFRRVAVTVLLSVVGLTQCPTAAVAHPIRTIKPSVCQRDWHTVAGNESQIGCMANYFDFPEETAVSIARCESGFRWNATSSSGTYRGTWQMGPMFESHRAHMLPNLPNASPYQGRHATIFFMRYAKHYGTSAWACA